MALLDRFGPEKLIALAAALVTGAAVFMMPQAVLQEAVMATGLPSVLPPLEPPLGAKARIGLALFATGLTFTMVVMVLSLLARRSAGPVARPAVVDEDVPAPPKVRRRDRHPDAPARAPLQIDRDIGLPKEKAKELALEPVEPAPVRTRLIRPSRVEEELPPEPEPEEEFELAPDMIADEPEGAEEPEYPEEREELAAPDELAAPEPAAPVMEQRRPAPVPQPEPVAAHPAWLDASAPQPSSSAQAPLVELVERLERALATRAAARNNGPAPRMQAAPTAPVSAPEPVLSGAEADGEGPDARLRTALESLKRFAPRRG